LFYRSWDDKSSLFASLVGYRSTAPGSSRGAALWLYWWKRSRESSHDVLFPLVWSFRSPQSNTTVIPPVMHFRRGSSTFNAVLPLWFSSRDTSAGTSWKLLLPLFFSRTKDHGRGSLWLTPLGGYRRNDDQGARALTFLIPPIIWRRDAKRELETYLLLYWRYRDLVADSTTSLIGPLYRSDDPEGSTRVAFPLYWWFRDANTGATAHTLLPLYFRRRSPDETMTAGGVLPLWFYHRRYTAGGSSFGLFPLAFFGRRTDERHAIVLPALFYHSANARSSTTLSIPFYYRFANRTSDQVSSGVPPLLLFFGREKKQSYTVQIPLFWRFRDDEKRTVTTVAGPVFWRSRPDGWSGGLAPLLFAGGGGPRRHLVLFPLFWRLRDDQRDRTTVVALNYLHRRQGAEVTDAFFPIFHYRRGAPPGGQNATSLTLLPLFHYRRTTASTVFVSPVAAWGRGRERKVGFIPPYFWYQSSEVSASGVPPLYFDLTRRSTGERTRMFGPYLLMDAPRRSARVLFPLWARYTEPHETGTYVFPTYFRRRTDSGYTVDAFVPFYWRSRWPGHATTVVGPFFRRTGPQSSSTGLLPLFVHSSNPKRKFLITPLYVQHANHETGVSRTFAPLYFSSSHKDRSRSVFFPLWWQGRQGPSSHRVLFPLFWSFANQDEKWSWNLLGPFLWSHNGTQRTRGLMPIAWYSRDDEKQTASHAVLPLFYERHGPTEKMVLTLPFGFTSAPDRFWFYVPPFVYRDTWRRNFWTLFPVWFSHTDKVSETRTRVVPPLLHYSKTSPDKSFWGALLLFWRQRDITSTTTLGLPLFYDIHSFHERRITMFLPLFVRYANHVTATSYTLAPLFYRRSSPADSTTIVFPLLWDFRSPDRRSTVVFPFYAGFRRQTWQGRYIFPNIWYRTGLGAAAGTSRLFVFPLWESAVKRPGDYLWEALLGLFGWERIGRNRYLKLLFIPFELEPAPATRTAWYGRPRPAARPLPARGVNTGVW